VRHYTQYLLERLDDLKPRFVKEINATVTYHDPCYLGRANGIYDEPRALLKALPGVELAEMAHYRNTSLCCGGGGGGMWLDGFQWEKSHNRLPEWRVREALAAIPLPRQITVIGYKEKARPYRKPKKLPTQRILAVACPYEPPRFEDAAKVVANAQHLLVKDIAELVADAMDL